MNVSALEQGVADAKRYDQTVHARGHCRGRADPIPNTSWGVDPSTNQVVVEIFDGVSAADEQRLMDVVADYGDAVTVDRLPGDVHTLAYATHGGIGIHSDFGPASHNCTLGFNVRNSATLGGTAGDDVLDLLAQHGEEIVQQGERRWLTTLGIEADLWSRMGD